VALADQAIEDSRLRISEMDARVNRPRGESCGSSDTSSKASGAMSSHRSRGKPRVAESEKSTPLAAQLEEMLSSVRENTVTVEYSDMIQPVAHSASTSRSTTGSRNTISTEWLSNESLTLRSSTLRQSRSFQEQVAIGVAPPTSTNRREWQAQCRRWRLQIE
jgi:hypothetical protein